MRNLSTKRTGTLQRTTLLLAAITLIALLLRVIRLDFQPLWWDEGYSVFFATRDFATLLARTAVDIHPPLYYILLQLWIAIEGKSDVAVRLFSVGIGTATIPLIYLFGSKLFGARVGLISALLLSVSPIQVYYSQEVRMYGLVTLLALISINLELVLLESRAHSTSSPVTDTADIDAGSGDSRHPVLPWNNQPRRRLVLWAFYVLVTAATLYTLYFSAFLLLAEILIALRLIPPNSQNKPSTSVGRISPYERLSMIADSWLWRARHPEQIRVWIAAWVSIIALYVPWLVYAGPKLFAYVGAKVDIEQYSRLDPLTFLAQHLTAFSIGHPVGFSWLASGVIVFFAFFVFGFVSAFANGYGMTSRVPSKLVANRLRTPAIVALLMLVVPLICGWLVNLVYTFHPVRYERLLLFGSPPFYVLTAVGLDTVWKRSSRWAYVGAGALLLISGMSLFDFFSVPRYPDEDYRPLISELGSMASRGDIVLAPYPWQIGYFETYYHGPPLNIVEVPSDEWISQPGLMDSALGTIRTTNPYVWLLAYQTKGRLLEDQIANNFADAYVYADDLFGNTRLEYFAQALDPPFIEHLVEFAPDLKLHSFGTSSDPLTQGASFLRFRLHWEAGSNAYSYSLRLIDESGQKRFQQDHIITQGNEIQRRGIFIPQDVPTGEYDFIMIAYTRSNGSPLSLPDATSQVDLARVVVQAR